MPENDEIVQLGDDVIANGITEKMIKCCLNGIGRLVRLPALYRTEATSIKALHMALFCFTSNMCLFIQC